ncbi:MAG: thioredoxin [Dysgonamonadaceae bacterium]|jgi:thioredoxin 1|nr:thioredoxin [Dysgonamonadaceae bacterium]
MAMQITEANFEELLNGEKPFVVDFWAEWCGPCKMISPIVDELAAEYEDQIVIGKVNVDENENLSIEYGIRSIPTLLFFKNGKLVDKFVGAILKETLEEKIKSLLTR